MWSLIVSVREGASDLVTSLRTKPWWRRPLLLEAAALNPLGGIAFEASMDTLLCERPARSFSLFDYCVCI